MCLLDQTVFPATAKTLDTVSSVVTINSGRPISLFTWFFSIEAEHAYDK